MFSMYSLFYGLEVLALSRIRTVKTWKEELKIGRMVKSPIYSSTWEFIKEFL